MKETTENQEKMEIYFGLSSDGKEGGSDGKEGSKDGAEHSFISQEYNQNCQHDYLF